MNMVLLKIKKLTAVTVLTSMLASFLIVPSAAFAQEAPEGNQTPEEQTQDSPPTTEEEEPSEQEEENTGEQELQPVQAIFQLAPAPAEGTDEEEGPNESISGKVWEDVNGDGIRQETDPAFASTTIVLYEQVNEGGGFAVVDSTVSDANGDYRFDGLEDGVIYIVSFRWPGEGFGFARPLDAGDDEETDSDVEAFVGYSLGSSHPFRFEVGEEIFTTYEKQRSAPGGLVYDEGGAPIEVDTITPHGIDAGIIRTSSMTGRVWKDFNQNGLEDEFEPGVADMMVRLYRIRGEGELVPAGQGVNSANVRTNENGEYEFTNLGPGEYYVSVPSVVPDSLGGGSNFPEGCFTYTEQNVGSDDDIDSDVEPVRGYNLGAGPRIDLGVNEQVEASDAGLLCEGVAGLAWEDIDASGTQNSDEPGVEGVNVLVYENDGSDLTSGFRVFGEKLTASDGGYYFDNLVDGYYYVFAFRRPSDEFNFTNPQNKGNNDAIDSDVEPFVGYSLGSTMIFQYDADERELIEYDKNRRAPGGFVDGVATEIGTTDSANIDAGLVRDSVVTGRVWKDLDRDGREDENEPGAEGMHVFLGGTGTDEDGNPYSVVSGHAVTDEDGRYTFENIIPAQDNRNYYVSVRTVVPDSLGGGSNLPEGCHGFTEQNVGENDNIDSDVEAIRGYNKGASHLFNVGSSETVDNVDAGLLCDTFAGKVWEDVDASGDYQEGEPLVEGVRVVAHRNDGTPGDGFPVVAETFTDTDGGYYFDELVEDAYYVLAFYRPTDEFNFTNPQDKPSDDTIDSDVEPFAGYSLGSTTIFQYKSQEETLVTFAKNRRAPGGFVDGIATETGTTETGHIDAGLVRDSEVTGRVWKDLNRNGLEDDFEPGLEGIHVFLGGTGIDEDGEPYSTVAGHAVTDEDGRYLFEDVIPAQGDRHYYVSIRNNLPGSLGGGNNFPDECYAHTVQDVGENDTIDSDVEAIRGFNKGASHRFNIGSGETVDDVDAGLLCNTAAGKVWEDVDASGDYQAGEPLVEGVRVIAHRNDGTPGDGFPIVAETFTDENGRYFFDDLVEDAYYVFAFYRPTDEFNFTNPQDKPSDDTIDSDVEPYVGYSLGSTTIFQFEAGDENQRTFAKNRRAPGGFVDGVATETGTTNLSNIDAGLVRDSEVTGYVWKDLDRDGLQDDFEPGIPGMHVFLGGTGIDEDGEAYSTVAGHAVTDASGRYTFYNVIPAKGDRHYYVSIRNNLPESLGGGDNFPEGCYAHTFRDTGEDDTIDSDVEAIRGYNKGASHRFNIGSDEVVDNIDAGLLCDTVAGRVWEDVDASGDYQAGEPLVEGVRVLAYRNDGTPADGFTPIEETFTRADGRYYFDGMIDGSNYVFAFTKPSDEFNFTNPQDKPGSDRDDSDVEPFVGYSLGSTTIFQYAEREALKTFAKNRRAPGGFVDGVATETGTTLASDINAGLVRDSSVTGRVWDDTNANGIQDEGEEGLEGVYVLLGGTGTVNGETYSTVTGHGITDANGVYLIENQVPAQGDRYYYTSVLFQNNAVFGGGPNLPEGCDAFTLRDAGEDDTVDSDAQNIRRFDQGASHKFNLGSGETLMNVDTGVLCDDQEVDDNGTGDNGTGDNGTGDNGTGDNGTGDNGTGDNGTGDNGGDEPQIQPQSTGGGGGGGSRRVTTVRPAFTGQSADEISLEPCLQIFNDRQLTFTDGTSEYAELLKATRLMSDGYKGEQQFVISGYGNTTNEIGTATIGLNNALTRFEAAKIVTSALLCYQIYTAESIPGEFNFSDVPRVYPENQWHSDLAYTAYHLGLITGRDGNKADMNELVTKQEFVTLIVRAYEAKYGTITINEDAFNLDYVDADAWYYTYYQKAEALGVMTDELRSVGQPLLRRDAFKALVYAANAIGAYEPESAIVVRERFNLSDEEA